MKAVNIQWDVDDPSELEQLPTEIEIPDGMDDEDEISDYISDVTDFCHYGFVLETNYKKSSPKMKISEKMRRP